LFAFTLANLTPVITSAIPPADPTGAALREAMRSSVHREVRVYDLIFSGKQDWWDYPDRWRRFETIDATLFDEMKLTALACGAFPAAFEPVTLMRYREEYVDQDWQDALGDEPMHPFTYMDGGTFNNEPVREAFRLSSFLDSHLLADSTTNTFDRRVIFV